MADKAQKKEETKKQVRALLLSAPAALTVNELKRDYHDFMGDPIPYRELGYTTLEDLLKDMQDALRVSWKNGVMCLEPVAQEASVHIQKLVSKQKVNNKNKWATLRQGGPSVRTRRPPPPRFHRTHNNNRFPQQNRPPLIKQLPPPSISAYIRKQISELLKSYPNGLPLTHFDTAFSRRFGVPLSPTGLGFNSMKELLASLPDIAKLKEFLGGEWRVAPAYVEQNRSQEPIPRYKPPHVSDRRSETSKGFQRQREQSRNSNTSSAPFRNPNQTSKLDKTKKVDKSNVNYQPAGIEDEYFMSPQDIQCEIEDFIAVPRKEVTGPISPVDNNISVPHAPRGRGRRRTGDRGEESRGHDSISSGGSMEAGSSPRSGDKFDVSIISEVVQNNIQQILEENRTGVWAIQLPAVYMKRYGKELSFRDYGYWSLVEMLDSLPGVLRLERPTDNGDWLCFDARLPVQTKQVVQKPEKAPPKQETVSRGRFSSRGDFDSQMEEKIRQVLQCKPEGVLLSDFPGFYKKLTGEVLPFKELGYEKIEFFMIPLADSVVHLEYKGDGCMLVYALDNGKPPRTDLLINTPREEDKMKNRNVPSDAVGPKVYYKPQELPPLHEYFEIFVSNVVSPGLFWIQVRGKKSTIALDKCMNDLEKLYCSAEGDQYKIPDYLLTVGQTVAAVFPEDNNWHRCVVTGLNVDKYVEMYFVDFGNTTLVHRKNIRLLRSNQLKLPAQAIQARLAHLQPHEEMWTLNARNRLLSLVKNRPLIALVNFEKDRVLSLVLVDTSTKVDVVLNDLLVTEGYARVEEDNFLTNFTGPAGHKEVPDYSHVYGEGFEPKVEAGPSSKPAVQNKAEAEESSRRYVQPIQLTGEYVVNLINLNDTAYLMSTEVSAFFWEADILTGMLEQQNICVNRLTLKQEQYPEVFEDLCQCGVIEDREKKSITLYELSRVPYFLDLFDHQSEELRTNVRELIQMFDPSDPFWKGEDYPDSDNASQASEDLSDIQVSLEDIQLSLQLLQFKRKRILQNLMTHPENMEDNVNQLKEVEDQINVLKDMQDQRRQRKALDPDSPEKSVKTTCPGPTDAATNDDKVKASVSEGMFERSRMSPLKGMPQAGTPPSNVSPIKTNVVAPMQNKGNLIKPVVSSQSQPSSATNQELINTLAQQQLLLQTMMMPQPSLGAQIPSLNNQFVRGSVPFQQPQSTTGQQYANTQRLPNVNMQYLATNQQAMNSQILNQQFAPTSQAGMPQQLMNQQFAASSQAGMNPQLMNLMQTNLGGNPYLLGMPPFMGGLPQQTQSQLQVNMPQANVPQVNVPQANLPQATVPQVNLPQTNVPLLSGLLPLLQTLNIKQGSSEKKPS